MVKYFITDDPRRGVAIRKKLRKTIRQKKKKPDPEKQFHKYESLAAIASKYGVTGKEISAFCYSNGVHVRTAAGVTVVDMTELNELLERVGIKPTDTAAELREEQKLFFTKTVNIR